MTTHTAIVLQGGGALGAYEYGVLKALYESRPGFIPTAVTGISIGAITAAVLGGTDDPIAALDELWRHRLPTEFAILGNPGMYAIDPWAMAAPWMATSFYSTAPLRRTLSDLIDPVLLNDDAPHVAVGAVDIESGAMRYFDNTMPGGLTIEHIAASGALPPGFPAVTIDGRSYWDGGLFSNLPLAPAINALEQAGGGARDVFRELIVVELFPMAGNVPTDLTEVIARMGELQYTSRLRLDESFFETVDSVVELVTRFDEALPVDSPIRDDAVWQRMIRHRRIDRFQVITADMSGHKANDFSRSAIEYRINAGYADAVRQGIA